MKKIRQNHLAPRGSVHPYRSFGLSVSKPYYVLTIEITNAY